MSNPSDPAVVHHWTSVVAGVDGSPASISAARSAATIAGKTGARYHLVYARPQILNFPTHFPGSVDIEALRRQISEQAATPIRKSLAPYLPSDAVVGLEVRIGSPEDALSQSVRDHRADLMVLGGKHHGPLARWTGGSTVHELLDTVPCPLMVTPPVRPRFDQLAVVPGDLGNALTSRCLAVLCEAFQCSVTIIQAGDSSLGTEAVLGQCPSAEVHEIPDGGSAKNVLGVVTMVEPDVVMCENLDHAIVRGLLKDLDRSVLIVPAGVDN